MQLIREPRDVDFYIESKPWTEKELKEFSEIIKKAKPLPAATAKLWDDLKEAAEEVWLHKQGKLKLKTAPELLNEL
jgi:hypothetical protein